MNTSMPRAANVFLPLAWLLGVLSALGNFAFVAYVVWTLTLTGHSYAQSDLGLFMLLTMFGIPVLITCGGMLLIGTAIRPPVIRISLRGATPLTYLLMGNMGVVVLGWLYLLLMP